LTLRHRRSIQSFVFGLLGDTLCHWIRPAGIAVELAKNHPILFLIQALWDMEGSSLFSRKNQTILVAFYLQPATCNLRQLVKPREILKTQKDLVVHPLNSRGKSIANPNRKS